MMVNLRGFFIFLVISSYIFTQNINTELIKNFPPNLKPGSRNTIVFRVVNNSEFDQKLNTNLKTTNNWRSFYNKDILIPANSSIIFPVSVMIPRETKPGYHKILLSLVNDNNSVVSIKEIKVQILKQIEIEVQIENIPKISIAGKDVLVDYSLYNQSNSPRRVFLQSTNGVINGASSLTLDVGETKLVNVFYETDPTIIKAHKVMVDIIVSSGPYQNSEKSFISIIPSKKYKSDKYHRLPTEVGLMYLYRNFGSYDKTGLQGHLFSRGSLNPENTQFLEVLARGPNQFDNTILGLYDEYHINYLTQNIDILIGDDNFSLTPLTEYGRYGTGIRAEYLDENHQIGFFYMKPRFFPDYNEELAGFINYNFDDKNSIKFSFLQKSIKGTTKPTNLYSAQYEIEPFENLTLDAEYSFGKKYDKFAHGYSIELANQTEKTFVSVQIIDAGKDFPGYYDNTRYLNGNFQYNINKNLTLLTSFHEDETNALRDTLYGVSPYAKHLTGGAAFSYRTNDYINLLIGKRERKDRMPLQKFHYEENFSRISFGNRIYKFSTIINGEMAKTNNLLTKFKGESYKSSLVFRYNHSQRLSISSMFQYYNTFRYSEDRSQEIIYGGNLSYNIGKHTNLNIAFQNAHNVEEYYRDRSLLDFSFSKYLFEKHQFEFLWSEAIKQKQLDDRDTYIGLKYTFHFGIPVQKIADLGHLRGRLINNGVEDITNIVLNLGGRIQFSDEDGLFVFNDIPPGEHYLYFDNASLDFNDIATVKMPMIVTIEPDKLTDIQIGLTKASTISGIINLDFEDKQTERLTQDAENLYSKSVIVELRLDDEVHRDIVNLNNSFLFKGLRPGSWLLKIYHKRLGNNFTIKNSEMVINLGPGETSKVNINVIKKTRRIRFQPTEIIVK